MASLQQIHEMVQQVAESMAGMLAVEVTIVDRKFSRVAGTGPYRKLIGKRLQQTPVFASVFQSGERVVIEDVLQADSCLLCENRTRCTELAQLCVPISTNGSVIGLVALVAFLPQQKEVLLTRRDELFEVVEGMVQLLAGKVAEQERIKELAAMKNELETIVNAVKEGIIALDSNGVIVRLNTAAKQILGFQGEEGIGLAISSLFPGLLPEGGMKQGREIANREVSSMIRNRLVHCVATVTPWFDGAEKKGAVAAIQEMTAVKKIVSKYSRTIGCDTDMILGISEAIQRAKKITAIAARSTTNVLIRGESGSGKELFARTLHCMSERMLKPFVALNCAAIPENLLESELFGYEEGAFTGARKGGKPGKFELADGGTLFLDEIGDMSLPLQAKLLRVLEEKRVERVGGTESVSADVRIVSATHKDIEAMVARNEFRQDLYYRINVFPLLIPPLRQRREDLPGLIRHFLEKHRNASGKDELDGIEDEAYRILISYDWPGNVRELENVMEYLVSVESGSMITAQNVASRISSSNVCVPEFTTIAEVERQMIKKALSTFGLSLAGKEEAAKRLGISKATLYRKLKEYEALEAE